jgi:queuine tRNA-ribosyltransferase
VLLLEFATKHLYHLKSTCEGTKARRGILSTDHGTIETPIFMPVGTHGTVKAVTQGQLRTDIKAQIILGNTYHLYLRPGTEVIGKAGGLHAFNGWDRPILTDSGGYQVFSLSNNRKLHERGAEFKSHIDGSAHLFTPENVVDIQRALGSDIMMVLDECPPYPSDHSYAKTSMDLTHRWALRGRKAFLETQARYGHRQHQFGIVQGCTFGDLRRDSAKAIADMDFEGNAIGGLSVGEPTDLLYEMTDFTTDHLPAHKARYLMGVGTPQNLLECVARGIDMFDCVMPTRNARNGMLFTRNGSINLRNSKWKTVFESADPGFESELCQEYTLAYLHHLFRSQEILGLTLASVHNLQFYLWLMQQIRDHLDAGDFHSWYPGMVEQVGRKL